jgi:hypothetical protein
VISLLYQVFVEGALVMLAEPFNFDGCLVPGEKGIIAEDKGIDEEKQEEGYAVENTFGVQWYYRKSELRLYKARSSALVNIEAIKMLFHLTFSESSLNYELLIDFHFIFT